MTEWQPIETAPKDRTQIILRHREWGAILGFWSELRDRWFVPSIGYPAMDEITHWMPLPEPPIEKESEHGLKDNTETSEPAAKEQLRVFGLGSFRRVGGWSMTDRWQPIDTPPDVAVLVDRLRRLGQRREMEGIYTDQNICEAAAAKLQETEAELTKLRDQLAEAKEALEPFAEHARRNANAMLCVPVADLRRARAVLLKLGGARARFSALHDPSQEMDTEAIRAQAYAEGFAAGLEKAARWHDDQQRGGHCGESATDAALRQRRNSWHKEAAAAIRAAIKRKAE